MKSATQKSVFRYASVAAVHVLLYVAFASAAVTEIPTQATTLVQTMAPAQTTMPVGQTTAASSDAGAGAGAGGLINGLLKGCQTDDECGNHCGATRILPLCALGVCECAGLSKPLTEGLTGALGGGGGPTAGLLPSNSQRRKRSGLLQTVDGVLAPVTGLLKGGSQQEAPQQQAPQQQAPQQQAPQQQAPQQQAPQQQAPQQSANQAAPPAAVTPTNSGGGVLGGLLG